jgi:hypothetical protein
VFTSVIFLPSDVTVNVPRYGFFETSGVAAVNVSGPVNVPGCALGKLNLSPVQRHLPAGTSVARCPSASTGPVEEIVTLVVFASSTRMLFTGRREHGSR